MLLQEIFTLGELDGGAHDLRIAVSGDKNPNATGFGLAVDAFEVEK